MVDILIVKKCIIPTDNSKIFIHIMPKLHREDRIAYFLSMGIHVYHTSQGLPIITFPKNLFMSIAHTENIAVIAISCSPCGIDIESSTRILDPLLCSYMHAPAPKALALWLEAEAYCKMSQIPLRTILRTQRSLYIEHHIQHMHYHNYHICLIANPLAVTIMLLEHPSHISSGKGLVLSDI